MLNAEELSTTIDRLRSQHNDDAHVEAKSCENDLANDVWESVSAFGNTHGGLLVLGLSEDGDFSPVKKFALDRVLDQFVSGIGDGGEKGKVTNPPHYEVDRIPFEGRILLVIDIEELPVQDKPCFITARGVGNGSYKRVDDKDIKLSSTEVFELKNALLPSAADKGIVDEATVADLDQEILKGLIAFELRDRPRALRGTNTMEQRLARLNVTNAKGEVRLAGLLATGLYPQQFFPKLVIDVTVHPGLQKSTPEGPRFLDRKICEGPLREAVDEAVRAIMRNLRTISVVKGSGRHDEPEIPEEVLREAVVNAVVHREYGPHFVGQSVSVDIYPDRVEIENPGGLWGGKTLETLDDGASCCRNAALMSLMTAISLPDDGGLPAEGQGSGIPLMIHEMASHALDRPRFSAGFDYFKVILGRGGSEVRENRTWIGQMTTRDLNQHEEAALLLARKNGSVDVSQVRNSLGIDSDEVRELFARLEKDGLLSGTGKDEYELVEKTPAKEDRPLRGREVDALLLSLLSKDTPVSITTLADETGLGLSQIRSRMKKLVDGGSVIATAPPQSKNRRYLIR